MPIPTRSFRYFVQLIISLSLAICSENLSAAEPPDDLSRLLIDLQTAVRETNSEAKMMAAFKLADLGDRRAIPDLIGIMDADNSDDTIYVIGHMSLAPLTGIRFDYTHHGPWWRKWWNTNSTNYDENVRGQPIPDLPKTERGKAFAANPPDPASIVLEPTLDDLLKRLEQDVHQGDELRISLTASWIAEYEDPHTIPVLISIIDADNSKQSINNIGRFGLGPLTGVRLDYSHHGPWWRKWWKVNAALFDEDVRNHPILDLPKTEHGKEFALNPPDPDSIILEPTLDDLLARLEHNVLKEDGSQTSLISRLIAEFEDPHAIPELISIIDADNSQHTIYRIGHFGLGPLTGVRYDYSHHGLWWRKWWMANAESFDEDVRNQPILDLPKTEHGKAFATNPPDPDSIILEPTLDDLMARLEQNVSDGDIGRIDTTATWIAEFENPRAIPILIDLITSDKTHNTFYWIGWFGLGQITGIQWDKTHDGQWWQKWWEENREEVEIRIADARKKEPPSGNLRVVNHERPLIHAEDVVDIPADDRRAQDDPYKRYILIGGRGDKPAPPEGYKVLFVLPGGSGSPDFHPFIKRIYRHVLSDEYLLVQIVAPEWDRQQAQNQVWPTTTNPHRSMKFSTEQFIDAVLDEIDKEYAIDKRHIFMLAWSSSGPPTYAFALQQNTRMTGAFVAMSVFKPETLPPIENANGLAFYILHSPQDFIPIKYAEAARDQLRASGATTKLATYDGGHGWRGGVYQKLRDGIRWLEQQVAVKVNTQDGS
ncbi:MAG: hypothetical protein IH984_01010 [Planctomycetes bacterium]|nr:hypothetical protein [Planctomycetota bacterium]